MSRPGSPYNSPYNGPQNPNDKSELLIPNLSLTKKPSNIARSSVDGR